MVTLSIFLLSGCRDANNNHNIPPTKGSENIVITNIEIRPNPYHLWPASNFKAGNYSVIVSVMNTGTVTCTSSLFFTLRVLKANNYGNFNSSEKSIGGATFSEGLLPNETKYVIIPIDGWLEFATAQGDFDSVVGTYKIRLSLTTNDPVNINQNIPKPLFEIVKGG
jgi:hypothetical protein